MTTWTAPLFEFIISSKALSQMTTWEKRGLGKILYSVRWYRSFSLDRITSNPFHAELIISIVNITLHYIVFHAQDDCILVQGIHFFIFKYNNFSEMGSYRSYRTYLNFPHHEIETKQHFCNKLYILLAKHYNKQIGPKCEKFFSVYWSLINDIWPQESVTRFDYDVAHKNLAYSTFKSS